MKSTQYLAAVAAFIAPTFAQTFTSCNPLKQTCPADPALGTSVVYDFTDGAPSDFTAAAGTPPVFTSDGAKFTITKSGDAPTLSSNWFIMFGHIKVVMSPAPGAGIVSSFVLQSADLDEVDLEWVGNDLGTLQTNYFGKGNTTTYDRGLNVADGSSATSTVTYEIDWTSEHLQWIVNNDVVRTLTPATAEYNQYPQTPMQVKLGNWAAGDSSNAGTSSWAGGPVDYSKGPYTMLVKSLEVTDYSTGKSYTYGDMSGSWESIKSDGGKISGSGSVPDSVSTASASGTTLTGKPTASALTETHISATTTASAALQTGSGVTTGLTSSSSSSASGVAPSSGTVSSSGSGSASPSGTGVYPTTGGTSTNNITVGTTPTASPSSSSPAPLTGAGYQIQPLVGFVAAGLLAAFAL